MPTLDIKNLNYVASNKINDITLYSRLSNFSGQFEFGKSYLFNGSLGSGNWVLAQIIAGRLREQKGEVLLNNSPFEISKRLETSWYVKHDEIKRFGFLPLNFEQQIDYGFKKKLNKERLDKNKLIQIFRIPSKRFKQRVIYMGVAGWRASCAIAIANGKKVFCFPFLTSNYVVSNINNWLYDLTEILKDFGALVIIPTEVTSEMETLADQVIEFS